MVVTLDFDGVGDGVMVGDTVGVMGVRDGDTVGDTMVSP